MRVVSRPAALGQCTGQCLWHQEFTMAVRGTGHVVKAHTAGACPERYLMSNRNSPILLWKAKHQLVKDAKKGSSERGWGRKK